MNLGVVTKGQKAFLRISSNIACEHLMLKVQTMGTNKKLGRKGLKSLDLLMGKGGAK